MVILALYTGYYIGGPFLGISSYRLHVTVGCVILLLTVIRLFLRAARPLKIKHTTLMGRGSGAAHVILYVLLILQPFIAVISKLGNGRSITLMGNIVIQPFFSKGTVPAHALMELHTLIGKSLLIMVGLHIAAAVIHYVIIKDNVVARMLPALARK